MSKYRVWCEDCSLDKLFDDENPPRWADNWSAKSAAKGKRDGHRASEFVDYETGERHSPHMEEVSADSRTAPEKNEE